MSFGDIFAWRRAGNDKSSERHAEIV